MFHFLLTSIFLCGLLKVSICTPWRSKISGRWRLKIFFRNDWFLYFFADGSVFSCRQNTAVIFRTATPTTHFKNNQRNRTKYHPKFKNVFDTFSELWRAISNILWGTDILASNYLACNCTLHSDFYYQIIRGFFTENPSCLGSFYRMKPHLNRAGQRTLSYPSLLTEHSTFFIHHNIAFKQSKVSLRVQYI